MLVRSLLFLAFSSFAYGFTPLQDPVAPLTALKSCQNLSSLSLPAFAENQDSPAFSLYFWTQKPLNSDLPTLALIPGGPGQTFHELEWVHNDDINLLYFDPRGMGCSTPTNDSLINNPEFYSAKRIAQDLEQLRKHLKIAKWSVYGHSYGTIPASIYASMFPDSVENLLLEGTVLKGGKDFWYSKARRSLLDTILQKTSPNLQEKILSLDKNNLHSVWFSQTLLDSLPQGYNKESFEKRLTQNYKSNQKKTFTPQLRQPKDLNPYFSSKAHLILSCKELAADQFSPQRLFYFEGNFFDFVKDSTYQKWCQEWPLQNDTYDAKNFPIKITTTFYFQGEYDYLTPQEESFEHYKNNQSQHKYFFSLKNGGHNPFSLSLNELNKDSSLSPLHRNALSDILHNRFNFNDFQKASQPWNLEWESK